MNRRGLVVTIFTGNFWGHDIERWMRHAATIAIMLYPIVSKKGRQGSGWPMKKKLKINTAPPEIKSAIKDLEGRLLFSRCIRARMAPATRESMRKKVLYIKNTGLAGVGVKEKQMHLARMIAMNRPARIGSLCLVLRKKKRSSGQKR
jgi:hypothetical protein